jgi:uncharacterized Tic20 family protein
MASKSKSTENLELVGHFVHLTGIFLSFLGPLILYLMYKDKANKFVKSNIIEALNFQLTGLVGILVCFFIPILGWFILLPIVSLILIIFIVFK